MNLQIRLRTGRLLLTTKRRFQFGESNYSDYTQHTDPGRTANYIARHAPRENWQDPTTAGFWSRHATWDQSTLKASIDGIIKRFDNFNVRAVIPRNSLPHYPQNCPLQFLAETAPLSITVFGVPTKYLGPCVELRLLFRHAVAGLAPIRPFDFRFKCIKVYPD